ncbi:MAG: hypothetical protein F6K28_07495 [Microcoleus sp. SIO2G3]|nr:hypothetical protein [Microcoleus sp. SIO2G3]
MLLTDTAAVVDAGYPDNRQLVINDLGEPVVSLPPARSQGLSPHSQLLERKFSVALRN